MNVKTRFAPSPTGYLHVGGVRTALFAYLFAKKHHGKIVLRVEDTDQSRSTECSAEQIFSALDWLGLTFDSEVVVQSQRLNIYRQLANQWVEDGLAYRCNCSVQRLDDLRAMQILNKQKPKYDGHCRERKVSADCPHVVRFMSPQSGMTHFDDMVYGTISVDNRELDDLVILKSDQFPTYNFAAVVDDCDMQITHVIRGEDHINNTLRQLHLFSVLCAQQSTQLPVFCHLPMILGDDKKRLSKRHGSVSVLSFRELGILPTALLNYLVRLGWSCGDKEIFTMEEMLHLFDLKKINKSGAVFSFEKLLWVNHQHLKAVDPFDLTKIFSNFVTDILHYPFLPMAWEEILPSFIERAKTLKQLYEQTTFLTHDFEAADVVAWQALVTPLTQGILEMFVQHLSQITNWQASSFKTVFKDICDSSDLKMKNILPPLRLAVTGKTQTPSMDLVLGWLPKVVVIQRIKSASTIVTALA